ncbi:MAG: prefoldin subunit alpha [Promethearchaeota archaeon]|nr:prefoldin subunit alpha [Candidatus Lokiarchaeota archaeon]MCK4479693.1 prefoldin subunit alpha [Candidatus Lokiarchaeota archaeon]TET56293.1 MAG: prefoldin subunit alpha [Candidatus Lokiarchaeota archaeon]
MEPPQEYQEQLIKIRYLREQYNMFQRQLEIINASLGNIMNTKITVENLKEGVKQDDEILLPIGGLVNIKASIKEPEKVLLAVTQDVIIEKDLDGALEFLNRLIEQHNKQTQFLRTQLQNIEMTLQEISQNVQRGDT